MAWVLACLLLLDVVNGLAKVLGIANLAYGCVTLWSVYDAVALGFHVLEILVRARRGKAA